MGKTDDRLARPGARRLTLVGARLGATQVLDILVHDERQQAVGIVDDDPARWAEELEGVPVVGATDRALSLFAEGAFDAVVISRGSVESTLRSSVRNSRRPTMTAISDGMLCSPYFIICGPRRDG